MNETVQYGLTFYGQGDVESASRDQDRMVVIDNQLKALSSLVGNGVLSGWNITYLGGLQIEVSPGNGMIGNIFSKTITEKTAAVADNSSNSVFVQSNILPTSGALNIEVMGPRSNFVFATYVDLVAPGVPTGLASSALTYQQVNLTWDDLLPGDPDLSYYQVERAVNGTFTPFVVVGTSASNGTVLNPFVDSTVIGSTSNPPFTQTYYYRVRATDVSGNVGVASATSTVTMPLDTHVPTNPASLTIYPGDTVVSGFFSSSPSSDIASYRIKVDRLNPDGTVAATPYNANIGNILTFYASGLANGFRHRVTAYSVNTVGNESSGATSEFTPSSKASPSDVASLSATSGAGYVSLSWTASPSPTGAAVSQKSTYRIRVVQAGSESSPIDVGLILSYPLYSFLNASAETVSLQEGKSYYFKVSTVDSFGNESGGRLVSKSTLYVTKPKDPSALSATSGHALLLLSWTHGSSSDVEGYNIAYDVGAGFGADVQIGYVTSYELSGLSNGYAVTVRIRARSKNGPVSIGALVNGTPEADTTAPEYPKNFSPWARDGEIFVDWSPSPSADIAYYVVQRTAVAEPPWIISSMELTPVSAAVEMNAGLSLSFMDTGLINGQTYAYAIKAVDVRGNDSGYDVPYMVVPNPGLNVLSPTYGESAVYSPYQIAFQWTHDTLLTVGYNIYRSTDPLTGYKLIETVKATSSPVPITFTYYDQSYQELKNGVTYYYSVAPAMDNSIIVVTTDGSTPANSILVGIVQMSSGIPTITSEKRVITNLTGTAEDYEYLLLNHMHSASPYNTVPITATSVFDLIDVTVLRNIDFSLLSLSAGTLSYYNSIMYDPETGTAISYPVRQIYVPHPVSVVYNVPFVGDFQLIVDNAYPTVEYTIDPVLNAIVFVESISSSYTVSMDGKRLTYYVGAQLDAENRSYYVVLDGVASTVASVDKYRQTIRFPDDSVKTSVVMVVEPSSPLYDAVDGAQKVSLWPNSIINDFSSIDGRIYTSLEGGWSQSDVVEARVDGVPVTTTYSVDASLKSITFASTPGSTAEVTLLVYGKDETQNKLLPENIAGIDASSFNKGEFTEYQLSGVSHEGRMNEPTSPLSTLMTTSDYFNYSPIDTVGNGSTPYSYWSNNLGFAVMGTSSGLLRSYSFGSQFVTSRADADYLLNYSNRPLSQPGLSIMTDGIEAEIMARPYSGRFPGYVRIGTTYIRQPNLALLSPTQAILAGGYIYYVSPSGLDQRWTTSSTCFIYDSGSSSWSSAASMIQERADFSLVVLSSGDLLASGGVLLAVDGTTIVPLFSCEKYSGGAWSVQHSLRTSRSFHSATVVTNPERVMVAGGSVFGSDTAVQINSAYDSVAQVGTAYSYTASATGSTNNFTFFDYPAWLTPVSNVISGTPAFADIGTYYMRIRATNILNYHVERTIKLEVFGPPSITSTTTMSAAVNRRMYYLVTSTGSISSITSTSTYFGNMTGPIISSIPADQGAKTISVTAQDSFGASASATITVDVYPSLSSSLECGTPTGESGFGMEGSPVTETPISLCSGMDIGLSGDVYFVDKKYYRVRKISGGVVTTVVGTGLPGYTGDGAAATAATINPEYVKVDPTETYLYISDRENGVVRMVNLGTGVISTFAGTGTPGPWVADGVPATTTTISPHGIFVTATDVYICDHFVPPVGPSSNRVRMVNIGTGIISTVAGAGASGSTGDGGLATLALLNGPSRVCVNGTEFYIADAGNHRIRHVDAFGVITTVVGSVVGEDSGTESISATSLVTDVGDMVFSGSLFHLSFGESKTYVRRLDSGLSTIVGELQGRGSAFSTSGTSKYCSIEDLNQIWKMIDVTSVTSVLAKPVIDAFSPQRISERGGMMLRIGASNVSSSTRVFLAVDKPIEATSVSYESGVLSAILPSCQRPAFSGKAPTNFTLILLSPAGASCATDTVMVSSLDNVAKPSYAISGGDYSTLYAKANAFDGKPTTAWQGNGSGNDWIGQDFGSTPMLITKIRWLTSDTMAKNTAFVNIEYSDDLSIWTLVSIGSVPTTPSTWVEVLSFVPGAHRAWRVRETTVATNWYISEMEMEASSSASGATSSVEMLTVSTSDWELATGMSRPVINHEAQFSLPNVVAKSYVEPASEQTYSLSKNDWTSVQPSSQSLSSDSLDGTVKQVVSDSDGNLFVVTLGNVYLSVDNADSFKIMDGLTDCEVIHRIIVDSSGNLYAASDVGVYFISNSDKLIGEWTQTSLLGSSTTEVADLTEAFGKIWAVTETGAYSTVDSGTTWVLEKSLPDCHGIEPAGGDTVYLASGTNLYRSDDSGTSWTKVADLDYMEKGSRLLARAGVDLLIGSGSGLYRSTNGQDFSLCQFSKNKSSHNNITMLELSGADVLVGFDDAIFVIDPSGTSRLMNEFAGVVPTVMLNGSAMTTGVRYNTTNNSVTFEYKRTGSDSVGIVSDYSMFTAESGGWYDARPIGPIQILVNGNPYDGTVRFNARTGQVAFSTPLSKGDKVLFNVPNTTFFDGGTRFHSELEDALEKKKGSLDMFLGRNATCDMLQMGISIEHNFLERGITRNAYEGSEGLEDRSFNSFLENSDFFIMGRKEYDEFNSTIDYQTESSSTDTGARGLVVLTSYLNSPTELWTGTENGIVVLDPTSGYASTSIKSIGSNNSIRDIKDFQSWIIVVSSLGMYYTDDGGTTFNKIYTTGLPSITYITSSLGSTIVAGTSDAIYYSDDSLGDPKYGKWTKATFLSNLGASLYVSSACTAIASLGGYLVAAMGGAVFFSLDGKTWHRGLTFASPAPTVFWAEAFSGKTYFATSAGIYSDRGSILSYKPSMSLEKIEGTSEDSSFVASHMHASSSSIYAVGDRPKLYSLQNETWSNEPLPNVSSGQHVTIVSSTKVVFSGNVILTG